MNRFATILLAASVLLGCTASKINAPLVPPPGPRPSTPSTPSTPDDPVTPVDPSELDDIVNNPARLSRIGKTPIIEIYYTEYTDADLFPSLEEVKCFTHINVGHARFADRQAGTGLEVDAKTRPLLQKFVAYKADYPELKVKLMIGGWGKNADGFSMMARDAAKRAAFIQNCVQACKDYGIDGFDIDWEYPTYAAKTTNSDGSVYYNGASEADYANFVTLFKEMREAMPDKILSYAASDSGKYTDNFNVLPYVDYINVMTYDEGNPPYHNAPLYRSSICKDRCCSEAIDDIFHGKLGVPYRMMNFGLAFYGHGDGYTDSSGNAYYPGSVDYSLLEEIFFKNSCNGKSVAGKNIRMWDDVAKVPYLADAMHKMYASYEDIESLNAKVEYLKSRDMLGAMIWEYRHDNAAGTLRHAVKHAMDGTPDAPGRYERPDGGTAPSKPLPVMGNVTSKNLSGVGELSGLCISKDGKFMWGVGDEGYMYKIGFDFSVSEALPHDKFYGGKYTSSSGELKDYWYDLEGITMDPSSGDLYIAYEPKRVIRIKAPAYDTVEPKVFDVADAADYGNSGLEGITWHKGNLYLGAQTGATMWEYTTTGSIVKSGRSLRKVTSTISEIGDMCYDPVSDYLWVVDSNSNKDRPEYLPFTLYLFNGDATELLATYPMSGFTTNNPEAVCVDHAHNCLWIADDSSTSVLHKVEFTNL